MAINISADEKALAKKEAFRNQSRMEQLLTTARNRWQAIADSTKNNALTTFFDNSQWTAETNNIKVLRFMILLIIVLISPKLRD